MYIGISKVLVKMVKSGKIKNWHSNFQNWIDRGVFPLFKAQKGLAETPF